MEIEEFKRTIANGNLPAGLPPHVKALWHDARGDWKTAHDLIDDLSDDSSAHVHAYLHRKEGDIWNADYWYKRAGNHRPGISLDQEWENLLIQYLMRLEG
ncbi:MAG: hypothetical protein V4687_07495 [Bacteroidota bacterium]